MLVIMVMGIAAALVNSLSITALKTARQETTAAALAHAKEALIGYAITYGDTHAGKAHGYLPCPDTVNDGSANTNQSNAQCAGTNIPVLGRLPWRSLKLPPLRDGHGECLWYAVSGTFKAVAGGYMNDLMNWDTTGQFTIQDADGITLAGTTAYDRPVAVIFSTGTPLGAQSHPLGSVRECSGDNSNSVTAYLEGDNAFLPPASPPESTIVLTMGSQSSTINNDVMLWITPGDIFEHIKKRSDFSSQINNLLDDSNFRLQVELGHPETVAVSGMGTKGTGNINCGAIANAANRTLCNNWKEMLLLTQLPAPSSITIASNGVPGTIGPCARVLIFGGQRTAAQVRLTGGDKSDPANYLEGDNLTAFATPTAASGNFSGASTFDTNNPSVDLLRCLP
ncbi:MAG: hypothetical protein Q7T29_15225 [Gallionella sp.]|nr:hypothetical protein [Gallionella sp.]